MSYLIEKWEPTYLLEKVSSTQKKEALANDLELAVNMMKREENKRKKFNSAFLPVVSQIYRRANDFRNIDLEHLYYSFSTKMNEMINKESSDNYYTALDLECDLILKFSLYYSNKINKRSISQ